MKWFKHLSGSLNDSLIFEAIETFGSDAYLVFFGTLEMMADEFDVLNPGISRISVKKLTKNFQISRRKVTKILEFFDKKAKESAGKNISFYVKFENDHVVITCRKLKDLCDEWTQKQLSKLGSKSGVTRDSLGPKEEEEEEEEDKKEKEKKEKAPPLADSEILLGDIITQYNELCPSLVSVTMLSPLQVEQLQNRIRESVEFKNLESWKTLFIRVENDMPFLVGQNSRRWRADLGWLVDIRNWANVLNGRYLGQESGNASTHETPRATTVKQAQDLTRHQIAIFLKGDRKNAERGIGKQGAIKALAALP